MRKKNINKQKIGLAMKWYTQSNSMFTWSAELYAMTFSVVSPALAAMR